MLKEDIGRANLSSFKIFGEKLLQLQRNFETWVGQSSGLIRHSGMGGGM